MNDLFSQKIKEKSQKTKSVVLHFPPWVKQKTKAQNNNKLFINDEWIQSILWFYVVISWLTLTVCQWMSDRCILSFLQKHVTIYYALSCKLFRFYRMCIISLSFMIIIVTRLQFLRSVWVTTNFITNLVIWNYIHCWPLMIFVVSFSSDFFIQFSR